MEAYGIYLQIRKKPKQQSNTFKVNLNILDLMKIFSNSMLKEWHNLLDYQIPQLKSVYNCIKSKINGNCVL